MRVPSNLREQVGAHTHLPPNPVPHAGAGIQALLSARYLPTHAHWWCLPSGRGQARGRLRPHVTPRSNTPHHLNPTTTPQDLGEDASAIHHADFSGCETLSAGGILPLIEATNRLKSLNLSGCSQINATKGVVPFLGIQDDPSSVPKVSPPTAQR